MENVRSPFKQDSVPVVSMQSKSALHRPNRIVVDSQGSWCPPTPMTDLFKAWRSAGLGDIIELRATEPDIEQDVRAWAKKSGNRVLEVAQKAECTQIAVRVTKRGKESATLPAVKASMRFPDEAKATPKAMLQVVTVGGFTLGLRTLERGWRWSTHMQPIAKTTSCRVRHIGYLVSGRLGFLMDDGTTLELEPGEAFDVHPGHDTWTIGEAPAVFIDMIGAVEREKTDLGPRR